MRKIRVTWSIGLAGARRSDIIEVDDDDTLEEIEEAARQHALEDFDWHWEEQG